MRLGRHPGPIKQRGALQPSLAIQARPRGGLIRGPSRTKALERCTQKPAGRASTSFLAAGFVRGARTNLVAAEFDLELLLQLCRLLRSSVHPFTIDLQALRER